MPLQPRMTDKGWEVRWWDTRGVELDEHGDLHPDDCTETIEDFPTKADALRRAHQILRGDWDCWCAVQVRKFEDWTDRLAYGHDERDYIGDMIEVS